MHSNLDIFFSLYHVAASLHSIIAICNPPHHAFLHTTPKLTLCNSINIMLKLNTHMNIEQSSCRCWYYIIRRSTKKILHTWKMISFFFSLVGWLYDHNNGEDLSFTCQWFRLLMV
ncbi:hypothetical protein AAHE18_20G060300 [Arachis hypogaea]